MDDFNKLLNEELKNPEFKQEWEKLELRYIIVKQLIKLRNSYNLSQSELAKKIGTTQAVISRIENGSVNVALIWSNALQNLLTSRLKLLFLNLN